MRFAPNEPNGGTRFTEGWRKLTRIWRSDTSANVDEEIRFHLEQKVAEFIATGASESDARRRAEAEFGDVQRVRESLRDIDGRVAKRRRRAEWWESFAQDFKYVVRGLRRSPAFSITVVVTLALGLGANAALFSVLDKLYVQAPSGVKNVGQLRRVNRTMKGQNEYFDADRFALGEIARLRQVAPRGVSLAGYETARIRLGKAADGRELGATYVEGDYFGVAGTAPKFGRFFSPDEYRIEGTSMVAVISYRLWQQQFAGDRAIVGQSIDLGSHRHVIVGVAPEKFVGLDVEPSDVWVPRNTMGVLSGRNPAWYENNESIGTQVVARLQSDSLAKSFDVRATAMSGEFINGAKAPVDPKVRMYLASIVQARGAQMQLGSALSVSTRLVGVSGAILLIACANVVNLLLARAATRQREVAVRLALGVSRVRLMSQLMMESGVLALVSSGVALLVAYFGASTLRALLFPGLRWDTTTLDVRVVLFTVALAIVTGIVAGIVPALQASRPNLLNDLKSSVRDGGRRSSGFRSALLISQAALSVVLLVGAGAFVRSLRGVQTIDIGFDSAKLMYVQIGYDRELGNRSAEIDQRLPEAVDRVRRLPGVTTVALSQDVPMAGFAFRKLSVPGRDSLPKALRLRSIVSPEYFDAVDIRVLRGRAFDDNDRLNAEPVMAIDENTASSVFPGEDPLTKCIIVTDANAPCRRVIAIVSPTHFAGVVEAPSQHFYLPAAQKPEGAPVQVLVIRTTGINNSAIANAITRDLQQMFGDWSRPKVVAMNDILEPKTRSWRVGAAMFTAAGLLALLVAAVGVYSSVAYTMSQRAHEMGVRVALGASARHIIQLVVHDGVRVVAIGVGVGIVAALMLGQFIASLLYQTSPRDPMVLATSAITLLLVAVSACLIPAWRAARVDPLSAMRAE